MRYLLNVMSYLYILIFQRDGRLTLKNWKSVYYAAILNARSISKDSIGRCVVLFGETLRTYESVLGKSVIEKAMLGLTNPKLFPENLKYVYYLRCLDFRAGLNVSFLTILYIDGTLSQQNFARLLPTAHFKDKVLADQRKYDGTEDFDNVHIVATLLSISNDVLLGKTTREYAFTKITELCYEKE